MKKILSLALAALMMVSVLPVAYAADVDYQTGTNVKVVGDGGEYYVTVPASLEPGQTGTVTAYGKWASSETVKVWTNETVEVTHSETGEKTTVNVAFDGIESLGNDLEDMEVTADISIDKGEIRFGEWTGVIEYNVEFDDGIADPVMFYGVKYHSTDSSINQRMNFAKNTECKELKKIPLWLSKQFIPLQEIGSQKTKMEKSFLMKKLKNISVIAWPFMFRIIAEVVKIC